MDMIRFVSSGSEATMAAIRLARGFTGKSDIVKIEGGFHGAHDAVLVKAGSGATTMGVPDSAGVPAAARRPHLGSCPTTTRRPSRPCSQKMHGIAALIIEPVPGNIGPCSRKTAISRDIREITRAHDVLLIFDEVITGYRLGIGGAQVMFGVRPDLTTLGKIIGGGPSDRRILRQAGDHADGSAAGPGRPGWHLLGKPPFACCRDRDRPLAA